VPLEDLAHSFLARVFAGLLAGAAIAAVDNMAFGGEVSPFVIVAMLLAATCFAGTFWGSHAWAAVLFTWACLPSAHLVKHLLGLPDTLHPNTYASILKLAAFTLAVATVGTAGGVLLRVLMSTAEHRTSGKA